MDLRDQHPGAYARLWWAAEAAKKQLSYEPYARVREESLVSDRRPAAAPGRGDLPRAVRDDDPPAGGADAGQRSARR